MLVDLQSEADTVGLAPVNADLITDIRTRMPIWSHRREDLYPRLDRAIVSGLTAPSCRWSTHMMDSELEREPAAELGSGEKLVVPTRTRESGKFSVRSSWSAPPLAGSPGPGAATMTVPCAMPWSVPLT